MLFKEIDEYVINVDRIDYIIPIEDGDAYHIQFSGSNRQFRITIDQYHRLMEGIEGIKVRGEFRSFKEFDEMVQESVIKGMRVRNNIC